jgi:hypothetical protein
MSAKIRSLKEEFIKDLADGLLSPITEVIRKDKTLFLCVRHNYINIYYQGGNIMKVNDTAKKGEYAAFFNINYLRNGNGKSEAKEIVRQEKKLLEMLPQGNIKPVGFDYAEETEAETKDGGKVEEFISTLSSPDDVKRWVDALPMLKNIMDIYFSSHEKAERFYQQMVCRENTRSKISEGMDYFITDIEYSTPFPKPKGKRKTARIDMVAVKWPSENIKGGSGVKLALIEMKYGNNAMTGSSGIEEHLKDMIDIGDEGYEMIRQSTEKQLEILRRLGLMPNTGELKVVCDLEHKPEYIMLLANTSPKGEKCAQTLKRCKDIVVDPNVPFELRFFAANYAGYGLYKECVLDIERFSEIAGK